MKVYIRRTEPAKGRRYRAVPKVGRRPTAEAAAKFHVRYPDADGKFVWSQGYDSFDEAEKAAAGPEPYAEAVARRCLGISNLDSLTDKIDGQRKQTVE